MILFLAGIFYLLMRVHKNGTVAPVSNSPIGSIVPPGSRAAVRGLSLQVRGGRCRSSAARAKCRLHNGFHRPTACAVRKRDKDALRRVILTPDAVRIGAHRAADSDPQEFELKCFRTACAGVPGSRLSSHCQLNGGG